MQTTRRTLRRSRADAILGGVAGGLAAYLHLDAALVRLFWALGALFGGAGVLLYLLAWTIIPDEDDGRTLVPLLLLVLLVLLPPLFVLGWLWPVTITRGV